MERVADTIVAPLTGSGPTLGASAISVIRVSGPKAPESLRAVATEAETVLAQPRRLVLSDIMDGAELLDSALVSYFKAPNSFTGEEVVEYHLHGGKYLSARFLELMSGQGVRLAGPGEFSERAFHNGRIDLCQAEAIADLVASETEVQARLASKQLSGAVSEVYSSLGDPLRDLLAELEAYIDFPEEDLPEESAAAWAKNLNELSAELERLSSSYRKGRLLREGINVVLCGPPNAGKSSLLNALAGENRVIVSNEAGTTRDTVEVVISIDGLRMSFWDTAGLETQDGLKNLSREVGEIEKEGMRRTHERVSRADLLIKIYDASSEESFNSLDSFDLSLPDGTPELLVANKADLLNSDNKSVKNEKALAISALKKQGLKELEKELLDRLGVSGGFREQSQLFVSNSRHKQCLDEASSLLGEAKGLLEASSPLELVAGEIRASLSSLDDIIGVTNNEEILGRIFSKFCIGK